MEGMIFTFNDDGTLREYKEPYATVDYATKEDLNSSKKQLNSTRKCHGYRPKIRQKLTKKVAVNTSC